MKKLLLFIILFVFIAINVNAATATFTSSASGYDCDNFTTAITISGLPSDANVTNIAVSGTIGAYCYSWYEYDINFNGSWSYSHCNGTTNFTNLNNSACTSPIANGKVIYLRAWDNDSWCDYVTLGLTVVVTYTQIAPSTAATSISGGGTLCAGNNTTLAASGGTLGTNATEVWFAGSCNEAYSQNWGTQPFSVSNTTVNSVTNGILRVTSTNGDPMIHMNNLGSFDPTVYRYINLRYRVVSGTAGSTEIFFHNPTHNYAVGGETGFGSLISDGQWHVLSIDMWQDPQYTTGGNIQGWRYDWATASGVTMDLDFISLDEKPIIGAGSSITVTPTATTTYYTHRKGDCGVSSCASTTVNYVYIPAPPSVSNNGPVCIGAPADLTVAGMAPSGKGVSMANNSTNKINGTAHTTVLNNHTIEFWVNPGRTVVLHTEQNSGVSGSLGSPTTEYSFAIEPRNIGGSGCTPTNVGVGVSVGTNGIEVVQHGPCHFPVTLSYAGTITGWTHIAVVHISNVPYLYVNGALVKSGLPSLYPTFPSSIVSMGYGYFGGQIDNIRVWNLARSQTNIINDMRLETPTVTTGLLQNLPLNGNGTALTGSNATVNGTYIDPNYYTYTWTGTSAPAASVNETQTTGNLTANTSYTVTASVSGCTSAASTSTTVTVLSPVISLTAGGNESVCTGANATGLTASITGSFTCGYQWQQSNDAKTWTDISGATSASYTPTGLTKSTFYRARTSGCVTGCNDVYSEVRLVAVTPTPSIQTQPTPATQTVCEGTNVSYSSQANLGSGTTYYRLVLTSAYNTGWHGIQEIRGKDLSGAFQTLSCQDASSSTYTDVMCNTSGGSYSADNAFDGNYDSGSNSTVQWLTPKNWGSGNTNYQNYGTYNPFFSPEWIEFSSPVPLAELWVYNGRYAPSNSDISDCFKDYYIEVSHDAGSTWNRIKEGTFNGVNGIDGTNNIISLEPTYTWKKGTTIVGSGKDLTLNSVAISDAGTYHVEVDYDCATGNSNNVVLNVYAQPDAATAGADQFTCLSNTTTMAANNPTIGTGTWTWSPSAPTYIGGTDANDYNAQVSFSTSGTYTGTWTITNGTCTATNDAVDIEVNNPNPIVMTDATGTCTVTDNAWVHIYNSTGNIIASVNSHGQNLGDVTAQVYYNGGNSFNVATASGGCGTQAVLNRSFKINSVNAPTSNVSLRLYFTDTELASLIANSHTSSTAPAYDPNGCEDDDDVNTINDLVVTQIHGATNEDGTFTAGDGTAYLLTPSNSGTGNNNFNGNYVEINVSQFSEFWIHGSEHNVPLPVELLSFEAKAIDNSHIQLDWITATEINNEGFEVQRSTDGHHFEKIAWVDGFGSSNEIHSYTLLDKNVNTNATYYYKLKQIDYDGQFEYSNIRLASISGKAENGVGDFIPNPANHTSAIKFTMVKEANVNIELYDATGKLVITKDQLLQEGNQNIAFDIKELASGTYTAKIILDGKVYTRRLMINK